MSGLANTGQLTAEITATTLSEHLTDRNIPVVALKSFVENLDGRCCLPNAIGDRPAPRQEIVNHVQVNRLFNYVVDAVRLFEKMDATKPLKPFPLPPQHNLIAILDQLPSAVGVPVREDDEIAIANRVRPRKSSVKTSEPVVKQSSSPEKRPRRVVDKAKAKAEPASQPRQLDFYGGSMSFIQLTAALRDVVMDYDPILHWVKSGNPVDLDKLIAYECERHEDGLPDDDDPKAPSWWANLVSNVWPKLGFAVLTPLQMDTLADLRLEIALSETKKGDL